MGNADWSLNHLEHDLEAGFAFLGRAERAGNLGAGEASALADGVLQCMNGALMKVSESLEAQARLRGELALLRDEFRLSQAAQSVQAGRIRSLETEVVALRQALAEEQDRVSRAWARRAADDAPHCPPDEHLSRPLVLRSPQGDFLGVTDRAGLALNLDGFLRLVERAGSAPDSRPSTGRIVATCWDASDESWVLTLSLFGPRVRRCYALETSALQTPNGNHVTLLSNMRVDGVPVSQDFVVQMFRQLRDCLQE